MLVTFYHKWFNTLAATSSFLCCYQWWFNTNIQAYISIIHATSGSKTKLPTDYHFSFVMSHKIGYVRNHSYGAFQENVFLMMSFGWMDRWRAICCLASSFTSPDTCGHPQFHQVSVSTTQGYWIHHTHNAMCVWGQSVLTLKHI